ncbi:TonB-linked SusC/RagA family outer membrane protein [Dyadobacter jejuensis]|uniref:TonB-linked SusC/RagA family outer membrane protein n=1 Tax=Dyadobacter jejuensis TaxID=1082580 RepID=A0A316ALN7_9BACT|nr:SusC/RagA family TonB-linked outer membrane protein [Dyadobacter jejuensis]PWJ58673.1 TonB-linked SusC/RagA family outer membrane protein [Dyadobacter jejuensis]
MRTFKKCVAGTYRGSVRYTLALLLGASYAGPMLAAPLPIDVLQVDRKVIGTITDESGETMPGVTVLLKGTSLGTTTDIDGNFQLNIPEAQLGNAVMVFSFIGYEQQEIPLGSQARIDLILKSSVSVLDQVVVVGYSSKKVKYLSSSVATIDNKKLRDVTSNELPNLLQGKAPGVVVSTSSGDPTSAARILIRGAGTISAGTTPLTVVDGNIGGSYNPVDIENVTVLKDVAATGLYGSRAANGVIIVTTKSGQPGKTKFSFNNTLGFATATTGKFKLMDAQQLYDYQSTFYDRDPSVVNTNTNWWNEAFRTAVVNNHNLSVSGGNEKTTFYISGNYYKEQGTLVENDKTGYNFRTNLQSKLTDKLTAKVLFNGTFTKDNYANSNTLYDAYNNMPFDPAYDEDGNPTDGRTYPDWQGRDRENFLHSIQYNYSNAKSLTINTDINLDYAITDELTFSTYNRIYFGNGQSASYNDTRTKQGGANGGELYNGSTYGNRLLTSNRLRYEKDFGLHGISLLGVAEAEKSYNSSASSSGKGLPPGRDVMSVATTVLSNPTGEYEQVMFRKYLATADYNYDNRYFLVGSVVNEFSSLFGRNNPTANFYQLGASWVFSNEDFLKDNKTLTFAKVRVSNGTVGNADGISNFASLGLYSISQAASYSGLPGAAPSQKGNPDLTWEKIRSSNIGFDLSFFNRIDLVADAYVKEASSLLYRQPLAATTGYSYVWVNAGSVRNKGFEFSLTSTNIKGKDFSWETNLNMAFNRNKVLELSDGSEVFNSGASQPIAVGHNMDEWNMPIWAGVDPENGDPLWEKITYDANGNAVKSVTNQYSEAQTADSRQFTGKSASPKFTGGLSNTLDYKGFTLSAFLNFVYGNTIYNGSRFYFDNDGLYESYNAMVLADGWNRWEKPGDIATHPKPVVGGNKDSNQTSSRYLEDGSYIRLRNIRLGYSVPSQVVNKLGFNAISVFVSGDNLWTGTKFSGPDPEVSLTQVNQSSGVSTIRYPISKKILFGVNFSF